MRALLAMALLASCGHPAMAEEAMPDHLREAFGVVAQAAAAAERGPAPKDYDSEAEAIGYVRAANAGRVPGEPLEGPGRTLVEGTAEVLAADLFRISGTTIRLQGVRAPGHGDLCLTPSGAEFDCAAWSSQNAVLLLAGKLLSCAVTETGHEGEARIGWCDIPVSPGDTRDLGRTAVRAGLLLTSGMAGGPSPYLAASLEAQEHRRGLWAGSFQAACGGEEPCDAEALPLAMNSLIEDLRP